jgi:hypothetical protein
MAVKETPVFEAPIAGESLTFELGGRPWQQPYQYTTVEEAVDFYVMRFADEEVTRQLLTVLKMGVPVTTVANTLQLGSVMEGKHSVDVGMLILPVIMEMIMLVADSEDMKYTTGLEEETKLRSETIDAALVQLSQEIEDRDDTPIELPDTEEEPEQVVQEEEIESETVERKGLMGRV